MAGRRFGLGVAPSRLGHAVTQCVRGCKAGYAHGGRTRISPRPRRGHVLFVLDAAANDVRKSGAHYRRGRRVRRLTKTHNRCCGPAHLCTVPLLSDQFVTITRYLVNVVSLLKRSIDLAAQLANALIDDFPSRFFICFFFFRFFRFFFRPLQRSTI